MSISSIGAGRGVDPSQMAAKIVQELDANKDNTLTKTEFVDGLQKKGVSQAGAENMYSAMDAKGTGKVTQADVEAAMKKMGAPGGRPPAGGAPGKAASADAKVYDVKDANKDGTVTTLEELAYDRTHLQNSTNAAKGNEAASDTGLAGTVDVTV